MTCVVLVAVLAVFAATASATLTHSYTGTFLGPEGLGGTARFDNVRAVVLDPETGDVYVYDLQTGKIYKFDAAGAPLDFSATGTNFIAAGDFNAGAGNAQVAVAPAGSPGGTAGDIYVANNQRGLEVFSEAGVKLGKLEQDESTCGVATDAEGNIFLGDGSSINRYTPTANPPTIANETALPTNSQSCNLAVDKDENIYAASSYGGLRKYEGIADQSPVEVDPAATTVAVAPGSGKVFADRRNEVRIYSPAGTEVGFLGREELSESGGVKIESAGVAVPSDETKIYVAAEDRVRIYGPAKALPSVTTEPATEVAKSTANIHGTISAAGPLPASCAFQYLTANEYFENNQGFGTATQLPCSPAGPFTGNSANAVSANLTNLRAGTAYYFRIVGSSTNGPNAAEPLSIETVPALAITAEEATAITAHSATLHGMVNPEGLPVTECVFRYRSYIEGIYHTVPCVPDEAGIGNGNSPVSVTADITGLIAGYPYNFEIVAGNETGTTIGGQLTFYPPGPQVSEPSVAQISETSAVFKGVINPNGEDTTYQFAYVDETRFTESGFAAASLAPINPETVGDESSQVEVSQVVAGLSPGTVYHVRLEATSGTGDGALETTFATYRPTGVGLPDGRAYEEVTPASAAEKNATSLEGGEVSVLYASPSGDAATYYSLSGAGYTGSTAAFPIYISHRGSSAWSSAGINPPGSFGTRMKPLAYSLDLSGAYVEAFSPTESAGIYYTNVDGTVETVAEYGSDHAEESAIAAESADGQVLLFESTAKLTQNATDGDFNLYAWHRSTGTVTLVDQLTGGTVPAGGAFAGPFDWVNKGLLGGSRSGYYTQSTLSADGTQAFYTVQNSRQIYLRQDPTSESGSTTLVSGTQKVVADPNGQQPATFLEATPNGSYVFFQSHSELTNDANTGPKDEGQDLYRYDTSTSQLTDITAYAGEPAGARVVGMGKASADGSFVYFVARGVLADGAVSGAENLYAWHEGHTQFITTVAEQFNFLNTRYIGSYTPQKSFKISADGRTIMFMSQAPSAEFHNPQGFKEIYRWQYGQGTVECVSCGPTNLPVTHSASLEAAPQHSIMAEVAQSNEFRSLSASGNRVFFNTPEALLVSDTNGIEDVYEWEAPGEGSCSSDLENGGCLYLISTGTGSADSYFADASENGNDVFFFTDQQLVGQDRDGYTDEYDARVGGGLAGQNPTSTLPCEGQACRGAGTVAPAQEGRGSSTFSGPGNSKTHKPPKKKHKRKKHRKHKGHHKNHKRNKKHSPSKKQGSEGGDR